MGWLAYGLGSENRDLPAFVVMISQGRAIADQPLYDRLWGSGFSPAVPGVKSARRRPVLFLSNPDGVDATRAACSTTWPAQPDAA
jgi:hypothetical protein